MRSLWVCRVVASSLVVAACDSTSPLNRTSASVGGATGQAGAAGSAGQTGGSGGLRPDGGPGVSATPVGLQYTGAVVTRPTIEISAPILPRTNVIYQPFPPTLLGEETMARDAALTFDWLLTQCAPLYPGITLSTAGATLTPEQLGGNYQWVARCSYEQYVAKPYWIPRLVDDVDICGIALGGHWRLINEGDLTSLTPADLKALHDAMAPIVPPQPTAGFSDFYFGFNIWIRARDGSIASASLSPTGFVVQPLELTNGFTATDHYEGGLALRCMYRDTLP